MENQTQDSNGTLQCTECGEIYDFTKNAGIMTSEKLISVTSNAGGRIVGSRYQSDPDLVSNDAWESGVPQEVKTFFKTGKYRNWRCKKCLTYQEYPQSFINYWSKNSGSNSKEGCFIATAAYGDFNHPTVMQFRHFRNNTLNNNVLGRYLVRVYYEISPNCSRIIKKSPILRSFCKSILDKLALGIHNRFPK